MIIGEKCSHGGDKDLRSGCCQRHQCQYLLKKSIWQSTPQVYCWPLQVLNNTLIYLRAFLKTQYMAFHLFQGKSRLMYKNIPLLLFIVWVWKGEYIPHSIPDHMLTELILVGLDGYLWISFPRNAIKLGRACILKSCILCIPLLLEGL